MSLSINELVLYFPTQLQEVTVEFLAYYPTSPEIMSLVFDHNSINFINPFIVAVANPDNSSISVLVDGRYYSTFFKTDKGWIKSFDSMSYMLSVVDIAPDTPMSVEVIDLFNLWY